MPSTGKRKILSSKGQNNLFAFFDRIPNGFHKLPCKYEKRNTAGHNRDLFDDKSKNIYADMPPNREQAKRLAVKADL